MLVVMNGMRCGSGEEKGENYKFRSRFFSWAGIQRTRHEHRCAATQPPSQDLKATVLNSNSCIVAANFDETPIKYCDAGCIAIINSRVQLVCVVQKKAIKAHPQ